MPAQPTSTIDPTILSSAHIYTSLTVLALVGGSPTNRDVVTLVFPGDQRRGQCSCLSRQLGSLAVNDEALSSRINFQSSFLFLSPTCLRESTLRNIISKIYITKQGTMSDKQGGSFTYQSHGVNDQVCSLSQIERADCNSDIRLQGNHYCSRDYGNAVNSYHYSNT